MSTTGEVMRDLPKAKGSAEKGVGRRGKNAGLQETHIKPLTDYGINKNLADRARRAANQRRWRARQAQGIVVYQLPMGNDVLNRLIDVGLLGEHESADAAEVVQAVLDALNDYFAARGSGASSAR